MSARFNPTAARIRECRALILDYVNAVYPASLSEEQLIEVMLELPEPVAYDHVMRDLGYLRDRGLLERAIEPHPVRREKTPRWKLTAAGVTFIERGKPWAELEGA